LQRQLSFFMSLLRSLYDTCSRLSPFNNIGLNNTLISGFTGLFTSALSLSFAKVAVVKRPLSNMTTEEPTTLMDQPEPLTPELENVINSVLKLYQCDTSEENFNVLAPDIEFEDPIAHARGILAVKAQWFSMPKVFSKSETLKAVPTYTKNPDIITINLEQKYTMRPFGNTFVIPSKCVLYLRGSQVYRHEDLWYYKPLPKGLISEPLRKLNAWSVSLMFGPKGAATTIPPDHPKTK